jgi:hypothetical protein
MISRIKYWFPLILISMISNSLSIPKFEKNSTQLIVLRSKNNIINDVCKNGDSCSSRKTIYMRSKTPILIFMRIICPCTGKFNYQCSNEYCTLNKIICDRLKSKFQFITIKKCGNDNAVVTLFEKKI